MGTMTHIFHSVIILHYHCRSHCNIDIANILENFFKSDILAKSSHPAVHTSDALKLLIIYKFGGFYLDLDYVVLRDLRHYKNMLLSEG